jgi:phosphatidate cytidylyltransferase
VLALGERLDSRRRWPKKRRTAIDNLNARQGVVVDGRRRQTSALLAGKTGVIVLASPPSSRCANTPRSPTRRGDHAALLLAFFVVIPFQYILVWMTGTACTDLHPGLRFLVLPAIAVLGAT